jgi:hypothetical protein
VAVAGRVNPDLLMRGRFQENEKEDVMAESVKGPASYFPSIEKTYGKPISHWMKVLKGMGDLKHMEKVAALKAEHGLGHGHANALVAHFRAEHEA